MKGMMEVIYCPIEFELTDGFTKALKLYIFIYLWDKLCLISMHDYGLKGVYKMINPYHDCS
jgi:hypothetical protein